jgi:hypothetical protein
VCGRLTVEQSSGSAQCRPVCRHTPSLSVARIHLYPSLFAGSYYAVVRIRGVTAITTVHQSDPAELFDSSKRSSIHTARCYGVEGEEEAADVWMFV